MQRVPAKIKDMPWSKIGEGYVLVDKEINKTYALDSVSFLVWLQCDGKTGLDKIVDVFTISGNDDIVKAAVSGILDKLSHNGLIKWI